MAEIKVLMLCISNSYSFDFPHWLEMLSNQIQSMQQTGLA